MFNRGHCAKGKACPPKHHLGKSRDRSQSPETESKDEKGKGKGRGGKSDSVSDIASNASGDSGISEGRKA